MTDDVKAPIMWRKPRSKVYDYNQEFGDNYYKPMIDYLNDKEIQGCFFEKPAQKIHLPEPMEVISNAHLQEPKSDFLSGTSNVDHFLVKAYSKQIKELNTSTAKTRLKMLNNITSFKNLPHTLTENQQTPFDSVRLLKGSNPGAKLINHYCHELSVLRNNKLITEDKYDNHLVDVNGRGKFDYHHNVLDMGGILPDEKFYDPEKVDDIVSRIRFKKADRVVPVLA